MSVGLPGLSAEESNTGSVHPSRFGLVLTTCILIISTRQQRSEAKTISESQAVSFSIGLGTRTDDVTPDAFRQGDLLRRAEKLPHGWCCSGISGGFRQAEAFEHQAKNALMLIEIDGLV